MQKCINEENFRRVIKIIEEMTETEFKDASPEMSIIDDCGLDSLDLINFATEIKNEFGVTLSLDMWMRTIVSNVGLINPDNFNQVIETIESQTGLNVPENSLTELHSKVKSGVANWDLSRHIVSLLKVETILALIDKSTNN